MFGLNIIQKKKINNFVFPLKKMGDCSKYEAPEFKSVLEDYITHNFQGKEN
jgi:hypothetical protein